MVVFIRMISMMSVLFAAAAFAQLPPVPDSPDKSTKPQPRLFVAKRTHQLGKVVEGTKLTLTWRLENHGDADLIIDHTKASCGCTVVKLPKEDMVIPPNGSIDLVAEFDSSRRRGRQAKKILVYTNDPVEPQLKLEFHAEVEFLYEIRPASLNLHGVQRGESAKPTLDVSLNKGVTGVEVLGIEFPAGVPLTATRDPEVKDVARFRFAVTNKASLGSLSAIATVKVLVNGEEQERQVPVRVEIVGDITYLPKVVDLTRQPSIRGRKLPPVSVRSVDKQPIEILGVSIGPTFDVSYEASKHAKPGTRYVFNLTVREDAVTGPYGELLEIRTSSLDQPIISVPVFGVVPPIVKIEPPILKFVQDGTSVGMTRRVKLQAAVQASLEVEGISCDNSAIHASVDREASARYKHLRYLDVVFDGGLPAGTHEFVLRVSTSLAGARKLEIPVSVFVAK